MTPKEFTLYVLAINYRDYLIIKSLEINSGYYIPLHSKKKEIILKKNGIKLEKELRNEKWIQYFESEEHNEDGTIRLKKSYSNFENHKYSCSYRIIDLENKSNPFNVTGLIKRLSKLSLTKPQQNVLNNLKSNYYDKLYFNKFKKKEEEKNKEKEPIIILKNHYEVKEIIERNNKFLIFDPYNKIPEKIKEEDKIEINNYNKGIDNEVVIDEFSGRLHSNVVRLKRNLRNYLYFRDEKNDKFEQLSEIDFSSFQPFLLLQKALRKVKDQKEKEQILLHIEACKYGNFYQLVANEIIELYETGVYYRDECLILNKIKEYLNKKTQDLYNELIILIKQELLETIFAKNYHGHKTIGTFLMYELTFIFEYIKNLKIKGIIKEGKKGYRKVARILQREETKIILEDILPLLNNSNIFVLTIHDAFIIKSIDINKAKYIINNYININHPNGFSHYKVKDLTYN